MVVSTASLLIHVWKELVGAELARADNRRRRKKKRALASFHGGLKRETEENPSF
jgi:hypothetical protein